MNKLWWFAFGLYVKRVLEFQRAGLTAGPKFPLTLSGRQYADDNCARLNSIGLDVSQFNSSCMLRFDSRFVLRELPSVVETNCGEQASILERLEQQ